MFHPVPRVDRWEPLIVGTMAVLLGLFMAAAYLS
jgi:hypothetical protein